MRRTCRSRRNSRRIHTPFVPPQKYLDDAGNVVGFERRKTFSTAEVVKPAGLIWNIWLASLDKATYREYGFHPDPAEAAKTPDKFNLCTGVMPFANTVVRPLTAREEGIVKPLFDHVLEVFCDAKPDLFDYLVNWVAAVLQHPGVKNNSALIIQGAQGAPRLGHRRRAARSSVQHGPASLSRVGPRHCRHRQEHVLFDAHGQALRRPLPPLFLVPGAAGELQRVDRHAGVHHLRRGRLFWRIPRYVPNPRLASGRPLKLPVWPFTPVCRELYACLPSGRKRVLPLPGSPRLMPLTSRPQIF